MMSAQKTKIKFESLDKHLIYLICEESDFCAQLLESLKGVGFQIQVLRNFNDLYGHLETGRLGYILVSRSIKEAFGEAHLGSFIQRRFRVPILTFAIPGSAAESEPVLSTSAEIMHLPSGLKSSDIVGRLTGFEDAYVKSQMPPAPPSSKLEGMVRGLSGLIKNATSKIPMDGAVKVIGLRIKAGDERFIVLCAIPLPANDLIENGVRLSLQKFLETEFKDAEISLAEIFESLTRNEYERLVASADHHWQGNMGPVECLLSLSADSGPAAELEAHPQGEGLCIPLETWLMQGSLAFPVYHWLERNQKRVRYAKPGRKFDRIFFERFSKRGVTYLLILHSDVDRYEIIRELCSRAA